MSGTETHHSELVKVLIHFEENGNEDIQMAVHENLVIGDSFYIFQRMQSKYPQLERVGKKSFKIKDDKVFLGTDCFTLTRPLECQRG